MSRVFLCHFLLVVPAFLSSTLVLTSVGRATEPQVPTEPTPSRVLETQGITSPAITEKAIAQTNQSTTEQEVTPALPEQIAGEPVPPSNAEAVLVPKQAFEVASDTDPMQQVTSVTQLSDVQPSDWAFEALRALVERYGCTAGYPDGTYRGNRAMTRYEFAAGLNACLSRVNELIVTGTNNLVTQKDLAALQRLQKEFAAELATLSGRVDNLEARTAQLEDHQFSTTTKLNGEVIFGLVSVLGGDRADGQEAERNPTLSDRVRLNFDTSFTGKDRLRTRIQANNVVPLNRVLQTFEGRVNFDGNSENNAIVSLLQYRFPLSSQTTAYIGTTGNGFVDFDFTGQLSLFEGGISISNFGLRNPVYTYAGGAGVGLRHRFGKRIELDLGYLAANANDPSDENGLFDGKYAGLAQLVISPSDNFRFGFTYVNTYSPGTRTFGPGSGGLLANNNFGRAVVGNAYAFAANYRLSPSINLGGWVGYVNQRYIGRGDADVLNWAVTLAFPDLGKKGNFAGILVGMEPKVINISDSLGEEDRDTSLHIDAFYRYVLNRNISITPGITWVTAPNHDNRNDDVFIGVVRTMFVF
ncbi:MAG TPA: iron uptake porin [Coleofasciculaceae cyanobacterium]|jgi:hypothetical protein